MVFSFVFFLSIKSIKMFNYDKDRIDFFYFLIILIGFEFRINVYMIVKDFKN